MMTLRLTDYALAAIARTIGAVAPEQGGALLGPPGADVVADYIHDAGADVTAVRYHNTSWLIEEVERIERSSAARFKGIIHSHPDGMRHPSGQDCREYAESLRLNPGLARYIAVIATKDEATALEPHELAYHGTRVSCYSASVVDARLHLAGMRPSVIPIRAALDRARARTEKTTPTVVAVDGAAMIGTVCQFDRIGAAMLLFSSDFPMVPPTVMVGGTAVPLPWDLQLPPAERLHRGLTMVDPSRTRRRTNRGTATRHSRKDQAAKEKTKGKSMDSMEARVADRLGATSNVQAASTGTVDSLFARTGGILSPELRDRSVVVVGVGSVGSYAAELLVRSGIGRVTLIDPDRVAPENLGRSTFVRPDIGVLKVEAVASRLREASPHVEIARIPGNVTQLPPTELMALVKAADLVVAATDDNGAQYLLDRFAYAAEVPAVFVGLYRGASGGEVIMTYPGSPCWSCATAGVREGVSASAGIDHPTDYGTGRLIAEPGLVADIQHVTSAAVKVGLSLLHDHRDPAVIARFLDRPRDASRTYVAFAMAPDYWFFPAVMGQTPGQHAFQSVWMNPSRRQDCPVCGPADCRTDPLAYPAPTADRAQLLRLAQEASDDPAAELRPE